MVAEMTVLAKRLRAYGEGQSKENMYTAIDLAYARVEKQLKKFREKVTSHHRGRGVEKSVAPKVRVAEALNNPRILRSERPKIKRTQEFVVKPMSAEEASMQLELSERSFLVFSNAMTEQVNVIYKREDGNHGLIEPLY